MRNIPMADVNCPRAEHRDFIFAGDYVTYREKRGYYRHINMHIYMYTIHQRGVDTWEYTNSKLAMDAKISDTPIKAN